MSEKDTRSPSQKIQDLEANLSSLYQTADNMARDLLNIKEAIRLLGNKVDSIVKASVRNEPINDETISKIMIENNVEDLERKVQRLREQGLLAPEQTVTGTSFVVGAELDKEGSVVNPRLQFAVQALPGDLPAKLVGSKLGDVLDMGEGKLRFRVDASYSIQSPEFSSESAPEAPSTQPTPEAPAAESSPATETA